MHYWFTNIFELELLPLICHHSKLFLIFTFYGWKRLNHKNIKFKYILKNNFSLFLYLYTIFKKKLKIIFYIYTSFNCITIFYHSLISLSIERWMFIDVIPLHGMFKGYIASSLIWKINFRWWQKVKNIRLCYTNL